jgi:hypothetical protein
MAGQNECGHHSGRSIDIGFYSGWREINLDSNFSALGQRAGDLPPNQ